MKQLFPIPLINPAVKGLNTAQQGNTLLGPEWAALASNCFFDNSQRLAARNGWVAQNAAITGTPTVTQTFEFVQSTGNAVIVSNTSNNKIYSGVSTLTDVTGTAGASANWQFLNFNDVCIGVTGGGVAPIFWTGSGSFAPIVAASGSVPMGSCGVSAFGRLWIADSDGHTIKYCGLQDYTNWGNAGSGSIDMREVWTHGNDTIVGIAAFFSRLIIFGQNHIVTYEDGFGSNIGLNPATMVVVDTIEGTGLSSRDSIQMITGGDMLYLSPNGLQSLKRAIVQKNNPIDSLDIQNKDYIAGLLTSEDLTKLRSVFSTTNRFYLLVLPVNNTVLCYDTLFPLDDGKLRMTTWTFLNGGPQAACYRRNNQGLLFGFAGGLLGLYSGFTDNGQSYLYQWWSSNFSGLGLQTQAGVQIENREKILKRLNYVIFNQSAISPVIKWGYDFQGMNFTASPTLIVGEIPEYGTAEYGANGVYNVNVGGLTPGVDVSQYSGQVTLNTGNLPGASAGRWLQVGVEATINGGGFAVQELDALVKIGRMV